MRGGAAVTSTPYLGGPLEQVPRQLRQASTPTEEMPSSPSPLNQEQIIEDIMGLEEKFGDNFGDTLGLPYMIAPQTVSPVASA